ncbi:MAG: hypothetical protein LUF77_07725 [Oscillospiraceae bacterium]|nr:hypothetical protein [Oscillospiraceae bacterium]
MASIKECKDSSGRVVYKVTVSAGRGRRVTRSWRPKEEWSMAKTERELEKFSVLLEQSLAEGKEVTRKEQRDAEEAAAREAAKLRTFRQYVSGVYLPTKRIEISENAYSCYEQMLRCHMLPEFGDFLLEEITPAMVSAFLLKMQQSGLSHETVIKLYNITNGVFKMAYLDETLRLVSLGDKAFGWSCWADSNCRPHPYQR